MGRHRASSARGAAWALIPVTVPAGVSAAGAEPGSVGLRCAGPQPTQRTAGRAVGWTALSALVGGAAAVVVPLIAVDRLPAAPALAADQPTRDLGLAGSDARAVAVSGPARPAITAITAVADRAQRPADLAALRKATRRSGEDRRTTAPPRSPAARAARSTAFVGPVSGTITSNFGPRWGTTHYGLDIANRIGTPIRSVGAGTVIDAGPASGFGLWVRVRLTDGTVTVYGHINRAMVREGQRVAAGDVIAEVGNRGNSTGPHLHFETRSPAGAKLDPLAWLKRRGVTDLTG